MARRITRIGQGLWRETITATMGVKRICCRRQRSSHPRLLSVLCGSRPTGLGRSRMLIPLPLCCFFSSLSAFFGPDRSDMPATKSDVSAMACMDSRQRIADAVCRISRHVQTHGPLESCIYSRSIFHPPPARPGSATPSGCIAHANMPLLSWGAPPESRCDASSSSSSSAPSAPRRSHVRQANMQGHAVQLCRCKCKCNFAHLQLQDNQRSCAV